MSPARGSFFFGNSPLEPIAILIDMVHIQVIETQEITMSNTAANRLATLNALRATKGMAPLKSWKESNAKLEAAIEKLSPAQVKPAPKPEGKAVRKALAKALEADKKPVAPKPGKRIVSVVRNTEFTDYCRAHSIDAKQARAKLRRAGVKVGADGFYALNEAVLKVIKPKSK